MVEKYKLLDKFELNSFVGVSDLNLKANSAVSVMTIAKHWSK
jgi:hypothetical protein